MESCLEPHRNDFESIASLLHEVDQAKRVHYAMQWMLEELAPYNTSRRGDLSAFHATQLYLHGFADIEVLDRVRAQRLHRNVLAIAVADKLARIAWTVLAYGRGLSSAPWRDYRRTSRNN